MPSFVDIVNGATAQASDVMQLVDAFKGTSGKGVPISITAVNDAVSFALAVKNNDAGASKAFIAYKNDGSVLLQADKNGVVASPDGIVGAAQVVNLTMTQTLINKTLTSPTLTGPSVTGGLTVGGGVTVTSGNVNLATGAKFSINGVEALGVSGTTLQLNNGGLAGGVSLTNGLTVSGGVTVTSGSVNVATGAKYSINGVEALGVTGTTLQLNNGGLASGVQVASGNFAVTSGSITASGVLNLGASVATAGVIRLGNATLVGWLNAGASGTDSLSFDASDRLNIIGAAAGTTVSAGSTAVPGNAQEFAQIVYNGNARKIALFNV